MDAYDMANQMKKTYSENFRHESGQLKKDFKDMGVFVRMNDTYMPVTKVSYNQLGFIELELGEAK